MRSCENAAAGHLRKIPSVAGGHRRGDHSRLDRNGAGTAEGVMNADGPPGAAVSLAPLFQAPLDDSRRQSLPQRGLNRLLTVASLVQILAAQVDAQFDAVVFGAEVKTLIHTVRAGCCGGFPWGGQPRFNKVMAQRLEHRRGALSLMFNPAAADPR